MGEFYYDLQYEPDNGHCDVITYSAYYARAETKRTPKTMGSGYSSKINGDLSFSFNYCIFVRQNKNLN